MHGPAGPLANRLVHFDINNDGTFDGQSRTDATGAATLSLPWSTLSVHLGGAAGTVPYTAQFSEGPPYGFAQDTATLEVTKLATVITVLPGSFVFDGTTREVSAAVTDASGATISDAMTIVTYDGTLERPVNAGSYAVLVAYAGDARYEPSSAVTTLIIERAPAAVIIAGGTFDYDAQPHAAPSRAVGVNGEDLGALTPRYRFVGTASGKTEAPATKKETALPTDPAEAEGSPAEAAPKEKAPTEPFTEVVPVDAASMKWPQASTAMRTTSR